MYPTNLRLYLVLSNPQGRGGRPCSGGMAHGDGEDPHRATPRRTKASARERSARSAGALEGSSRGAADEPAPPVSVPGAISGAAAEMATAVQRVASKLGSTHVDRGRTAADILSDESSREAASRWRTGSDHRRFTALLARVMSGLANMNPLGQQRGERRRDEPPVAVPRPLQGEDRRAAGADRPRLNPMAWARRLQLIWGWRTILALVVIMIFPRLFAMVVTLSLKLLLKGFLLLLGRLLRELFLHFSSLAAEMEQQLMDVLQNQLQSAMQPDFLQPQLVAAPGFAGALPQPQPLPTRPVDGVSVILLLLQFRRGGPVLRGGGGGGEGDR